MLVFRGILIYVSFFRLVLKKNIFQIHTLLVISKVFWIYFYPDPGGDDPIWRPPFFQYVETTPTSTNSFADICWFSCKRPIILQIPYIQVVPGRAGGGSFRRKKNYIAKKEFAYRMCARRLTSAMPQTTSLLWTCLLLFHGGDVTCFDACHVIWCGGHLIWCDVIACVVSCHVMQCDVMWCASCDVPCNGHVVCSKWFCDNVVIQSTILYYKVLLCTTKCYSSTTLYYNVLLQYYSVLQSTTTYYSSTTLYYKVLLQYYSVLQSTTPVLLCTAKYYSGTTLYYKVLLQYYSVLQSTTPVLLCTTRYYSSTPVLFCTTQYYNVLLQYYPVLQSITLYCKVLIQYYPVLQSTTPVLLCTAKFYSSTALYYKVLQYYSVLQSTTTYYSSTTLYYKVLLQ